MYIIDAKLKERERRNDPIRVGVIGAGEMARGLINQINRYTPGMAVAAVCNRTVEKAEKALTAAGCGRHLIARDAGAFARGVCEGIPVLTDAVDLLLEAEGVDVLVELTGRIPFGLRTIEKAFANGKNVVSFNAELEATFGPYLKERAERYGVLYTLGDGDQPGVTLDLHRHVTMMGFTPLVCGNVKGMQDRYRNPATQRGFAEKWGMTPEMVTSFADGTKISFEQACVANAAGMRVARRGMIGLHATDHVDDMTGSYDAEELKEGGGIVDYVVGARPGPGVFVYAATDDPLAKKYLRYCKLGDGPLYSFYEPYHLLFFELAFSIVRLIDFRDVTLDAAAGLNVEVVAVAKTDLAPGCRLDGPGGFRAYGLCENSGAARRERLLPMGLAEGCIVRRRIPRDDVITLDDVEISDPDLLALYLGQPMRSESGKPGDPDRRISAGAE